ncbi:MAG: lipopolysaccharide export LptBFGC system permease protein LptF [Phycisphaerales bacterium]|jgi:lipopolysaccharide export LptBFGC system permease protein LptF
MKKMTVNFIVLFTLFFLLGAVIDIVVNLDEFGKTASALSADSGIFVKIFTVIQVAVGYEGPRLFQVFAYLHGVIAIGAMCFTAANMLRSREFVAIMAAGISLQRIAFPFVYVMAGISVLALLNQEFMLPKVAPLLLRDHEESGSKSVSSFSVPFTKDSKGSLLLAPSVDPSTGVVTEPSFLERDSIGRMVRQIKADSAYWDEESNAGWILTNGVAVEIAFDVDSGQATTFAPQPIDFYETDLSPSILMLRRYSQYIGMLGMTQLNKMIDARGAFGDETMLLRHWYSRFASIALNLLTMIIAIPFFVTKDDVVISRQAIKSGAIGLTILFGGMVVMLMPIAGVPAMVSVFLPSIVLIPIALLRGLTIRT